MIEISEINSRETLKQWLDEQPQDTYAEKEALRLFCVWLGYRAAMRVFPICVNSRDLAFSDEYEVHVKDIPITLLLWCLTRSSVVARGSELTTDQSARDIYGIIMSVFEEFSAHAIGENDWVALSAFLSAAYSLEITEASLDRSIELVPFAIEPVQCIEPFWEAARADCSVYRSTEKLIDQELWISPNTILEESIKASSELAALSLKDVGVAFVGHSPFWGVWYESILNGYTYDLELEREIASIDAEVWLGGFSGLMDTVNGICNAHLIKANDVASD